MDRNQRVWISGWATVMGLGLLLLHNWVTGMEHASAHLIEIWPLYILVITLPLTFQLLAIFRRAKLLWLMTVIYVSVMSGVAVFMGWIAWPIEMNYRQVGASELFILIVSVASSWFILLPFAEHRLSRTSWFQDYALLFSAAWCNAAKLLTATVFIGLLWSLLMLWAGLFKVLKVDFFYVLFTDHTFIYPVTAIAFGIGLSLYSAKEDALVGLYSACLNVIAWLLPLVSFILLLFLLALPVQGIEPLWKTGHATTLMLSLIASVVFLFNAAWQDGSQQKKFPNWLLTLISMSLLVMPVYIGLCIYSLSKRVDQYGWSNDRIWTAFAIMIFASYSLGYAFNVLRRKNVWMVGVKLTHIVTALLFVILLILFNTPLLNPYRLSVNNQVSRLLNHQIAIDDFDFEYLRFDTGRYGIEALNALLDNQSLENKAVIDKKINQALQAKYRTYKQVAHKQEWTIEKLTEHMVVFPRGTDLDQNFLELIMNELGHSKNYLYCLNEVAKTCMLLALDLNGDGKKEWIVFDDRLSQKVYQLDSQSTWKEIGRLDYRGNRLPSNQALILSLTRQDVETMPRRWQDLRVGDQEFHFQKYDLSE
ncbi:DUF4153 domain-containing protein [Ampullimonas aquatilis]|uniref:DUF4153 domain-containing protein n=1 Tax=Ampullimonas aquatilis TaxID=1341549 RepID=UPI003C725F4D